MQGNIYDLLEACYFDSNQSAGALYHTNCRPTLYTNRKKMHASNYFLSFSERVHYTSASCSVSGAKYYKVPMLGHCEDRIKS